MEINKESAGSGSRSISSDKFSEEEYKDFLDRFQCERNRQAEESFARAFSETADVNLFFINEDSAYTDGKNIIVDPASHDIYKDEECLKNTGMFLKWPAEFLADPWNALKMTARSQTLHEALHLIYTNFPPNYQNDPFFEDKDNPKRVNLRKTIAAISNIIEDAYIEAAGASVYDNIEPYLKFGRIAHILAKKKTEGTAASRMKQEIPEELKGIENTPEGKLQPEMMPLLEKLKKFHEAEEKIKILVRYLDYMAGELLYPMFIFPQPEDEIREYVQKTKELFLKGSIEASPNGRYEYCKKILEHIYDLVPEDCYAEIEDILPEYIAGAATHGGKGIAAGSFRHKGKTMAVKRRLFAGLDGIPVDYADKENTDSIIYILSRQFAADSENCTEIINYSGELVHISGADLSKSPLHKDVKINVLRPKINLNLRKAYQNIYDQYHLNINSYCSRFLQILKLHTPVMERRFLFGSGIDSKDIGDPKRRFWHRKQPGMDIPDIATLLLIDGSGSMYGARRNAAMVSAVILHEVLKRQGMEHCIAEHRGNYHKDSEIDVNILLGFNAREEEKYNIMQLEADCDNRDGLALLWAEDYINRNSFCEKKLIIVLSDGQPSHSYGDYYPPVSVKDTANIVKKIISRGTEVIGVALDNEGEYDTYEKLKEIYPHLAACNDLKRLTGQILRLISRYMR